NGKTGRSADRDGDGRLVVELRSRSWQTSLEVDECVVSAVLSPPDRLSRTFHPSEQGMTKVDVSSCEPQQQGGSPVLPGAIRDHTSPHARDSHDADALTDGRT